MRPSRRGRSQKGQSLVEFALIVPILLTMCGAAVDFARVYSAYINVQSATRNAAEAVATDMTITSGGAAAASAQVRVCTEIGVSPCSGPKMPVVTVLAFSYDNSSAAPSVVTLKTVEPFDMLFPYPFMSPAGHWDLTSTITFSVIRNR